MNVNLKNWIPVQYSTYPGETSLLLLAERKIRPHGTSLEFYVGYCVDHIYYKYDGVYGKNHDKVVHPQYYIVLGPLADFRAPEMG